MFDQFERAFHGVGCERRLLGQQFRKDDSQTEHVRSTVHQVAFAPGLFGAHVGGRSHNIAMFEQIFLPQSDAEVDQMDAVAGIDKDVGRFDIPMHEAPSMGMVQRVRDGGDDSGGLVLVERPF